MNASRTGAQSGGTRRARRGWLRTAAALLGVGWIVGCGAYANTTFVHSADDCDAYVWPNQQAACRECVQRPPPPDGIWIYWPNEHYGDRCQPGNPQPY